MHVCYIVESDQGTGGLLHSQDETLHRQIGKTNSRQLRLRRFYTVHVYQLKKPKTFKLGATLNI